jgi:hypothetical protein
MQTVRMTPKDYEKAVLQRFRTLWPPPRFVVKHDVRLSGRKTKARRQVDVSIFETGKSQPSLIVEAKRHKRPIDAGIAGSTIARSGETGSFRKARTPESAIPKVSSVVATGRAIKGAEMFMATPCPHRRPFWSAAGTKILPSGRTAYHKAARKPQIFTAKGQLNRCQGFQFGRKRTRITREGCPSPRFRVDA